MGTNRKAMKLGSEQTFDAIVIFNRTLGAMTVSDFDLEVLFI
jgi:hypothetical protein